MGKAVVGDLVGCPVGLTVGLTVGLKVAGDAVVGLVVVGNLVGNIVGAGVGNITGSRFGPLKRYIAKLPSDPIAFGTLPVAMTVQFVALPEKKRSSM